CGVDRRHIDRVAMEERHEPDVRKKYRVGVRENDDMPPLVGIRIDRFATEEDTPVQVRKPVGDDLTAGRIDHTAVRQKPYFRAFHDLQRTGNIIVTGYLIDRVERRVTRHAREEDVRPSGRKIAADGL